MPDSPLPPPPSPPPSTRPIACALELFLPGDEEQFRTILRKNDHIPRIRYASEPGWEMRLDMVKELVVDP